MFGYPSRVTSAISNNISYAAFLIIFKVMLYKGVRKREIFCYVYPRLLPNNSKPNILGVLAWE